MKKYARVPRVVDVKVQAPYGLRVAFDDDVTRDVDLSDDLWGPVFEPLKDPAFFAKAFVDHGTVAWPNGADLDPLVLHGDAEPSRTATPRPAR